jgi:queuosine precursor transporter
MSPDFAKRQECVYMILAGLFLGTLGVINILGLSRFVDLSFTLGNWTLPMFVPLGVLPYPITFLCTDIITEFYGKARANRIIWIGLGVNLWIFFIVWLGGVLPPHIDTLPVASHPDYAFFTMRTLTMGAIIGSMVAYLIAQLLDVHVFHYCKNLTKGKHLWLRNNASTLISQFVDTVIVITIAYYFSSEVLHQDLTNIILGAYSFKVIAALLGTIPFYLCVYFLKRYFGSARPVTECDITVHFSR